MTWAPRVLAIAVMGSSDIRCISTMRGNVNGDKFIQFLQDDLAPMLQPFDGMNLNSIVVMDNAAIHHAPRVRDIIEVLSSSSDSDGRFLLCNFFFRDVPFRVACVYAPNYVPERDDFFSDVASRVVPSVPTVIVRDFNTVFDRAIDRMGSVVGDVSRESSIALGRLFSDVYFIDIWMYLHLSSSGFTWTKADGSLSSRIDLIGCPYIWVVSVSACDILPCPFSDHCAVVLSVSVPIVVPPGKKSIFNLFMTFGLLGDVASISFPPWRSGGRFVVVGLDSTAAKGAQVRSRVKWVEEADCCEGLLTPAECKQALLGIAHGKAPGSDGLPMEFFVKFWDVLGLDLVDILNSCYLSGSLSLSQRRGIISFVFKKGDRLDARNWRPISLLNVDYKLASRAIAGHLLKVIHSVVIKDQTCGVPGRFIGENVALLWDVVDFASSSNVPVAIISLDQEKAFDRVVLAVCSPLLYVLVSEVLPVNVRANPAITGFSLPGVPAPLSPITQYADDTSLIVGSDRSIWAVFDTYSLFEKGSGAKLNLSKSKGLWLGSWCGRQDPPVSLDWTSNKIKVLAVFIGAGNLDEDNWRPRIDAVENVLSSWAWRTLSYGGRASMINALALSRVWYVASLIDMPGWSILNCLS
ncbi:uncharacterized protein LOC122957977 [Acropora millepora]|uniref:uncharacterized protein LOC122957977 n=1 Tax=Acropora millepora TaxID=45264 RepID=UPI001CF16047|nr:uncharacterized protein LOC122957977 [Acropora millepora]